MENAVLILNSKKNFMYDYFISKLSLVYKVKTYFLDDINQLTQEQVITKINRYIIENNVKFSFFQGCYISLIDFYFISKIKTSKKILYLTDDFDVHEVNSITAKACDIVLTGCPISKLRYEEKLFESYYLPLESDDNILKNYNLKKDIDVLFFGKIKADRNIYLKKLKKEDINIKILGTDNSNFVSHIDLAKYISRSKIVVNFSQTGGKNKFYSHKTIKFNHLQLKGRVLMAGLCKTLCVSEKSPATKLIFKDSCVYFNDYEEMCSKIKSLLEDSSNLDEKTLNFHKVAIQYADTNYFPLIAEKINQCKNKQQKLNNLPFWYKYIFFKKKIRFFFKNLKKKFLFN